MQSKTQYSSSVEGNQILRFKTLNYSIQPAIIVQNNMAFKCNLYDL